jgi:hypothetical protein
VTALIDGLAPEQLEEPGIGEGLWSVKELLWHFCCWMAEAARQLERVRMGTYEEQDWDTDGLNARYLEEGREQDFATVRAELAAARTRALQEWDALPKVTPEAVEWFGESGPEHYREHLADLRAWVEKLPSGA